MAPLLFSRLPVALAALALSCAAASSALAQDMSTNSSSFNAGYGRVSGSENRPVDVGTRDANGNRVIIDGVIQSGVDQSSYASADFSGVGSASGGASAIGNNLVVVTQGSHNIVIIDSTQINNGNVSAGTQLNGGVSNGP